MQAEFTRKLLQWNSAFNKRQMPWKGEKDPYRIWLSEIILQQTRVEQGTAYYNHFITQYPTINDLASAPDTEVFKLWEGLGYYSRCKNLLATARFISSELNGQFPSTYQQILALKGVGPYTAAAISSFAFNAPQAVVDGNVQRVIARYFGITTPIDTGEGKKIYSQLAQELLDEKKPAAYNQAIMDFGATICKPRNPLCSECVQQNDCEAFRHGSVEQLPVKEKVLKKRNRWLYYFLVEHNGNIFIRKRIANDIWQNLHEFLLVETEAEEDDAPAKFLKLILPGQDYSISFSSKLYRQQLTHQKIRGKFFVVSMPHPPMLPVDYIPVNKKNLEVYAFPKFINSFLEETVI